jgi:hypothetical protein
MARALGGDGIQVGTRSVAQRRVGNLGGPALVLDGWPELRGRDRDPSELLVACPACLLVDTGRIIGLGLKTGEHTVDARLEKLQLPRRELGAGLLDGPLALDDRRGIVGISRARAIPAAIRKARSGSQAHARQP